MPKWSDTGILLSLKPYGENSVIASLFTAKNGRHLGLLRKSSKRNGEIERGNIYNVIWYARLIEQLGTLDIELEKNIFANVIDEPIKLLSISALCEVLENVLPEREGNRHLWSSTNSLLEIISLSDNQDQWLKLFVKWELNLLKILGFQLKLDKCGITGRNDELTYISPKTGNAISFSKAGKYKNKLFLFPSFLGGRVEIESEITSGFQITSHFLNKWVFEQHDNKLPESRKRLQHLVMSLK